MKHSFKKKILEKHNCFKLLILFFLAAVISSMAGLAQVEYINISYSDIDGFSADSHLLITAGPQLKYSWLPWCYRVSDFSQRLLWEQG